MIKEVGEYRCKLKEEPSKEDVENYIIKIQVPGGVEFVRSFCKFDKLQSLVDFVASKGFSPRKYAIWRMYPREKLSAKNLETTFEESGVERREKLKLVIV